MFKICCDYEQEAWKSGSEGQWHKFVDLIDSRNQLFAECAGITVVTDGQKKHIEELAAQLLPPPQEYQGFTTLIKHKIDVHETVPVKHTQ